MSGPATKLPPFTVVFEGLDGAGKTTQVSLLESALAGAGICVMTTGVFRTRYGQHIRHFFMDAERMSNVALRTQLFLLGSAMNQVIEEIVESHASVALVDRFVYTTMAYHGGGLALGIPAVEEVYRPVLNRFRPDLVIMLNLPSHLVPSRARAMDRIEVKDLTFFTRAEVAYRDIMSRLSNAMQLDATQDALLLHRAIVAQVMAGLSSRAPNSMSETA